MIEFSRKNLLKGVTEEDFIAVKPEQYINTKTFGEGA